MPPKRKTVPKENVSPKRAKKLSQDDGSGDSPEQADGKVANIPVPAEETSPPKIAAPANGKETKLPAEVLNRFDERPPGKLLIAGMINWELTGQKLTASERATSILYDFHRFTSQTYRAVVSGSCSGHSVLIDLNRKALAFGRNKHGQLGQNNCELMNQPKPVIGLEDVNVIQAACGRHHTLFLTDAGTVYACGDNRSGQCGVGNTKPAILTATPVRYSGPPIVKVACGAQFSMMLDINGSLYSFGLSEYGQLGHNTDGKYFITTTRLAFHNETIPRKVVAFGEKTAAARHTAPIDDVKIVDMECGNNHTVAIDSNNRAFSWGFGGYGRLGHAEQADEWVPRLIKYFDIKKRKVMRLFCGTAFSLVIDDINGLYLFGRNNYGREANMYPKPVPDLMGWNITTIGAGYSSVLISAEDALIAWGGAPTYGELGIGSVVKSSSQPKKVDPMEGMKIPHVTMGQSHSLLLVNVEHERTQQIYETLPEFVVE